MKKTTFLITFLTIQFCVSNCIYGQNLSNKITQPFGLTSKSLSSPILVDIDNDGDLDAFCVKTGMGAGTIYYQENTGTNKAPSFSEVKPKPFGLTSKSLTTPTFVDIDSDGDLDVLFVGTGFSACIIYYQENIGTNKTPTFSDSKSNPFGLTSKSLSSPIFIDIDNDGDKDAFFVGTGFSACVIYYQENIGTNKTPTFSNSKSEPFGLTSKSLTSPTFVDFDNDGDLDAFFVGTGFSACVIYYQENIGTNKTPTFSDSKSEPFGLTSKSLSSPIFIDIDNDGILDAFCVGTGFSACEIYIQKK